MEKIPMNDIRKMLKSIKTPVVLYGTGNGADRLIDALSTDGVKISGIFASDGFVRKRSFRGFEVESFDSLYEKYPDMTVLMCFGSERAEVRQNIEKISALVPLYFPEYPVYGDNVFDYDFYLTHKNELDSVRSLLADSVSVETLDGIIDFRITGILQRLFECETENEPQIACENGTVFLDIGAYNGDTVLRFASENGNYGSIIAVEPDKRSFRKLTENTAHLQNVQYVNKAIGSFDGEITVDSKKGRGTHTDESGRDVIGCVTADTLLKDVNCPVIIKVDCEGGELAFIEGAKNVIRDKKPAMRIACYHRSEDLFTIPLAVSEIRRDYKVFLRHKNGVPSWNTEYFFV